MRNGRVSLLYPRRRKRSRIRATRRDHRSSIPRALPSPVEPSRRRCGAVLTTPGVRAAIAARSLALSSGRRLTRSRVSVRPVPEPVAPALSPVAATITMRSRTIGTADKVRSALMRSASGRRSTATVFTAYSRSPPGDDGRLIDSNEHCVIDMSGL